jgi:uncharacterized protein
MTTLNEITEVLRAHSDEVKAHYHVKELGVFGSVVRGEQRKRSDIDILVKYEELPDLLEFIALERYLRKLLKKKVDLVEKDGIRPELREKILREVVYI